MLEQNATLEFICCYFEVLLCRIENAPVIEFCSSFVFFQEREPLDFALKTSNFFGWEFYKVVLQICNQTKKLSTSF